MKKGFTLIELLIVIAILAILTTTVVLVLNPAQMLAEARDSQRMSDLDSVRSAISLYLATATSTPTLGTTGNSTVAITCGFTAACTIVANYTVGGSGWVGVNLNGASGGSPLSVLPRDPISGACTPGSGTAANCQYAYRGDNTAKTFELNAVLESTKYGPKMIPDGGDNPNYYEIGTAPGLAL